MFFQLLWTGIQLYITNRDLQEIQRQFPSCQIDRISSRVVTDFVSELLRDDDLSENLHNVLVRGLSASLEGLPSPVMKKMMQDISRHFLPKNLISLLDNLAVANYSVYVFLLPPVLIYLDCFVSCFSELLALSRNSSIICLLRHLNRMASPFHLR
jgi:hypothetical protein